MLVRFICCLVLLQSCVCFADSAEVALYSPVGESASFRSNLSHSRLRTQMQSLIALSADLQQVDSDSSLGIGSNYSWLRLDGSLLLVQGADRMDYVGSGDDVAMRTSDPEKYFWDVFLDYLYIPPTLQTTQRTPGRTVSFGFGLQM